MWQWQKEGTDAKKQPGRDGGRKTAHVSRLITVLGALLVFLPVECTLFAGKALAEDAGVLVDLRANRREGQVKEKEKKRRCQIISFPSFDVKLQYTLSRLGLQPTSSETVLLPTL